MARELHIPYGVVGSTDLYLRFRNASGQYRRGDNGVYETFNAANIALYGADAASGTPYHVASEDGSTGDYFADLPDATARGYSVYLQSGAAPSADGSVDVEIASGSIGLDATAATQAQTAAAAAITAATLPTASQIDTQLSNTHGAGAWGGSTGTGARAVTFTVTDADTTLAIEKATVRLYRTGSIDRTGETNSSGVLALLCDVDATWSYTITHPLYGGASGTVVVDGNEAVPVGLTAVSWPASTAPNSVTVRWLVKKDDRTTAGAGEATVYMAVVSGPGTAGFARGDGFDSDATDASGYVYFANVPVGSTVAVKLGTDSEVRNQAIPTTATSPYDGGELMGDV